MISRRAGRLVEDQGGVSEVFGTMLSVSLTVFLFVILAATVLGFGGSGSVARADVQGVVYTGGSSIVLTHVGGDAIPTEFIELMVFVNQSSAYQPNFTLVTQSYVVDTDGVYSIGDRLMVNLTVGRGATVEIVMLDIRKNNIFGNVNLVMREGQNPTTTSSTVTTTTIPGDYCTFYVVGSEHSTNPSHDDVHFVVRTAQGSAPQVHHVDVSWTPNGGSAACTLGEIEIERSGKNCGLSNPPGSCGSVGGDFFPCSLNANDDHEVRLNDFRNASGGEVDMRGAIINVVVNIKCTGGPDIIVHSFSFQVPW